MVHRVWPMVTLIGVLTACGQEAPGVTTYVDSAGVKHTTTPDAPLIFAEVDPNPVLSLGGPDVSGPTQFFQVRGIHVDSEGNLWIADGGSNELRIFRPDGSHWRTRGGTGEGPGEFERIHLLGAFRGDSVAVWDDANPRLTVYDALGELARTVPGQRGDEPAPSPVGVFPDGSILAKKPVVLLAGALNPGQLFGDTVSLVRVDLERRTEEEMGLAYGPLWIFTGTNQVPIPFTVNAPFVLQGEDVHLSVDAAFRIQIFQGGHLTQEYGVDRNPRPVTQEAVDAYVALYDEYISDPAQRREYLSTIDNPAVPSHLPSYDRLVVGDEGNVWAQIYTPDRSGVTWDVFAPSRQWLGQVELPAGFSLYTAHDQHLVGVWRDELGVEYVRVYRMHPAGAGLLAS